MGGRGLCTCLCHSTYSWEGAVAVRRGPEFLFPFIITYLTNHPCTSIVFVFSPRPTVYALGTAPPWGLEKRGRKETPFAKALFSHREHSVFAQGVLRRMRTLFYSDHRRVGDEKKMSGLKIKQALGFQRTSLSFQTESRRTRLIFSPTIPPYRCTVACTSLWTTF